MRQLLLSFFLLASFVPIKTYAQTIETIAKELPSHFSVLTWIALQFGFMKGAGDGQGIFLLDFDKYQKK